MALKLGWTQNAVILEECEDSRELAWYLRSALEHHWTKAELLGQIQAGAWLREGLDEPDNTCYTENNTVSAGCLEHEEDPFCLPRQELERVLLGGFWRLKRGKSGQERQRGTTNLLLLRKEKINNVK